MLFKKSKPKPIWYVNPWGIRGGLFGSATIVLALANAYIANWLAEPPYVIFISVIILLWGFLHSKSIDISNDAFTQKGAAVDLMDAQHEFIKLSAAIHEEQEEKIKSLEAKIAVLEAKP